MTVSKSLIWSGSLVAVLGALVLIFQATMFLVFGDWYGFSILFILQRLGWDRYLATGVQGIDQAVSMALDVPLTVALILIGGLVALIGYQGLRDEIRWSRRS